ncbi:Chorion peroxidase [Nymphon striatum]|nr:Chorion peroxidase [Nymphon striatum]
MGQDLKAQPESIFCITCKLQSCSAADVQSFSKQYLDLGVAGFKTFSQHCRRQIDCSKISKEYRTIDGTCNNLNPLKSLYGSVGTPLERFLPAAYSDYISLPRKHGKNGDLLLPARYISEKLMSDIKINSNKMTTMMVYFGELLVHDFAQTDIIKLEGKNVPCCRGIPYDGCIKMYVSRHDFFYRRFRVGCLSLARSKATLKHSPGSLLPGGDGCQVKYKNCKFVAGDSRVNQNAGVSILHTVFLRAHNNIAKQIRNLKPSWIPDKVFQETRKIIGAMVQSITYREYVPLLVGTAAMRKYNLTVGNVPDPTMYDATINPAIRNSFSTAAFRFGHATIQADFDMVFNDGTVKELSY